jgi:excisionase family DNA binding protein
MADRITLYTTTEVARILGFSNWTVRDMIRRGRIEAVNVSSGDVRPNYRISDAALKKFLRSRTKRAA